VRLGTRGSALALAQATAVARMLGADVEIVEITTSGDEASRTAAASFGDKSRFVKEIEEALLAGEIDLAVHSAKDVPGVLPDGLAIVGVPAREDAAAVQRIDEANRAVLAVSRSTTTAARYR